MINATLKDKVAAFLLTQTFNETVREAVEKGVIQFFTDKPQFGVTEPEIKLFLNANPVQISMGLKK